MNGVGSRFYCAEAIYLRGLYRLLYGARVILESPSHAINKP